MNKFLVPDSTVVSVKSTLFLRAVFAKPLIIQKRTDAVIGSLNRKVSCQFKNKHIQLKYSLFL